MSGFAAGLTEESLKIPEKLVFQNNEIVKCQCTDFYDNATENTLNIKVNVLSGPHAGKKTSIFLNSKDNATSQKVKVQFLKAFWTVDEICGKNGKELKLARLVGRVFTVKSRHGENKDKTKTYQNWEEFTDIGPGESAPATSETPPATATAQQAAAVAAGQATF
jgi:hypothetical protein